MQADWESMKIKILTKTFLSQVIEFLFNSIKYTINTSDWPSQMSSNAVMLAHKSTCLRIKKKHRWGSVNKIIKVTQTIIMRRFKNEFLEEQVADLQSITNFTTYIRRE